MSAPFPTVNTVFLVGRLIGHSVEAGTGVLDLKIDIGGSTVDVRVSDKILAAAIEPSLESSQVLQVSGSIAPAGARHQVAVLTERGHDVRLIGHAHGAASVPVRQQATESVATSPVEQKPEQPDTRPAVTPIRRTLGRAPVAAAVAPEERATGTAAHENKTVASPARRSFIKAHGAGAANVDQEPAASPKDDGPAEGCGVWWPGNRNPAFFYRIPVFPSQ